MVQIPPLMYAIPVISHATYSSSASGGSGLAVRQSIKLNSSELPPACQSPCEVINTISDCTTISCECTTSIGNQLEDCMNCLVSYIPSVESAAQVTINDWNKGCNGSLHLSSSSTKSGGVIALTGNMVTCVVALLGIAGVSLYL